MIKVCKKCKSNKPLSYFSKNKVKKDGLHIYCKLCVKQYSSDWYSKNKEKVNAKGKEYYINNKKAITQRHKEYNTVNKDKIREYNKKRYSDNREEIISKTKSWYLNNKDRKQNRAVVYRKERYKNDTNFKLTCVIRSRLNKAIKNNQKTGSAVVDLGCTIEEFKLYIESLWEPGMTWNNWTRDGWHIDHIKPLASFDLDVEEELYKATHYTNMQPLWAKDNLKKSDKYE